MNIYKAHIIGYPHFFITGVDEKKQMIHQIKLFDKKESAQEWVQDQKSRYKIKSSRVSLLPKSVKVKVSDYRVEVTLKIQTDFMSNFEVKEKRFEVMYKIENPTCSAKWDNYKPCKQGLNPV